MNTAHEQKTEPAILITRTFDAPRELVWKAWTQPEQMMQWWGPKDFSAPFCKIDARPGGVFHCCMRSPDGKDYWSRGVYKEVIKPERIVVTDSFADAAGNVVPASAYGMDDWPDELMVTLLFDEEEDGKTLLTLRHAGMPPGEGAEMCATGWSDSFDKLDEFLAAEQE